MRYVSMFLFLLLAACAAKPNYNQTLQQYVGVSEVTLQEEWGVPNNMLYITPDEKVVTYLKIDNGPIGGNTEPYAGEVAYAPIATPNYGIPQHNTYYCQTSFTIRNGMVVNYSFNGDDCVNGD